MRRSVLNKRGSVIVLVAVSLVALMGMAALAIDLGMLRKVKAEAQRAADAASLAGAAAFLYDMSMADKVNSAHSWAQQAADTNYMHGEKIDTTTEITVTVIPDSAKVRVKVRRAAIGVWFAKIFGINSLPVGAVAAAEASDLGSGAAACVKPFALPDMWQDTQDGNGGIANRLPDGTEEWLWNTGVDTYAAAHTPTEGLGTGLGSDWRNTTNPFERDWGRQIVMRPSVSEGNPSQPCPGDLQGNKCYVPGWWGLWGGNNPDMRDKILGCDGTETELDTTVEVETGWRQTLNTAVETVYNRDPEARWDPNATSPFPNKVGSVVGSNLGPPTSTAWMESDRVWIMAMVDPDDIPPDPSDHDTEFNNFMLFFFEGCIDESGIGTPGMPCGAQSMLVGRFLGKVAGSGTGPTTGTLLTHIRLVE